MQTIDKEKETDCANRSKIPLIIHRNIYNESSSNTKAVAKETDLCEMILLPIRMIPIS